MDIMIVAGARPNFIKIAPILKELRRHSERFTPIFVHTGQHYDIRMSQSFLDDLEIGEPDIALGVGSGSHAVQTARVMEAFEEAISTRRPDRVIVVGDVNSTMACALVCAKSGIPIDHVEAGLRSFDRRMPEEINRIVTDTLSDLLFTHSPEAREHLTREGVPENRIHFVGNVMIDCLIQHQERIDRSGALDELHLQPGEYALLTLHRPSNVDAYEPLKSIADALGHLGNRLKIVFSIHPRTRKMLDQFGLTEALSGVSSLIHLEPQPYFDFLKLQKHARLVLTDSGGVQEETTFLGVPCLTLRENTERPVTLTEGTSRLVGSRTEAIIAGIDQALAGQWPAGKIPEYWDGQASGRIVHILSALV